MYSKKNIVFFMMSVVILLSIVLLVNYIIDPFQQYRKASLYKVYYGSGTQRYINPGLAKNYIYDTAIIGTSMTENFYLKKITSILGYSIPLKFSFSGGSAYEESLIVDIVMKNTNTKNIIFGLDIESFYGDVKRIKWGNGSMPFYLYNDTYFDDYKYLLNIDTLKESLKALLKPFIKPKNDPWFNLNTAYQWQHLNEGKFGTNIVLKQWKKRNSIKIETNLELLKNSFNYNFFNKIKKNKKIEWIIFFPPYSILSYLQKNERKELENYMLFKKYLLETLVKFENVKVFDFQVAKEITHDLDNYKDFNHYHQKINLWMLNQIKGNKYMVTNENYLNYIDTLNKQITSYKLEYNE